MRENSKTINQKKLILSTSLSNKESVMEAITEYADIVCVLCGSGDKPAELLLCDGCNRGFHTHCMNLPAVPPNDWYCPRCNAPKVNRMHRVHLYERVSSVQQDAPEYGRVGLSTQNKILTGHVSDNNLVPVSTHQEVGSARNPNMLKQLGRICKTIKRGECILVYSVSRFSRNIEQGREFLERIHVVGAWVYSVTERVNSLQDEFLLLIQEAQHESDRISQRQLDSIERIRKAGGLIGAPPFGYIAFRDEHSGIRFKQECPEEQKIIEKLRSIFEHTQHPLKTAQEMNSIGILRRGNKWTKLSVLHALGTMHSFGPAIRASLPKMPKYTKQRVTTSCRIPRGS
jgi:DNA invertase Pin-like site-specific DNA recombinase